MSGKCVTPSFPGFKESQSFAKVGPLVIAKWTDRFQFRSDRVMKSDQLSRGGYCCVVIFFDEWE